MQVLVLGLGVSGKSAAEFLLSQGAEVLGVDKNIQALKPALTSLLEKGLKVASEQDNRVLDRVQMVVLSPGIDPSHPLIQEACRKNIEVVGEIELACRYIKAPMIGITGTNGKTTVTSLVEHVLNESGKKAVALGNIGVPLTSQVNKLHQEIVVLELSSYQLETLSAPLFDSACILNITPDHLDRYKSMENYAKAKFLLENSLKRGVPLILEHKTFQSYRPKGPFVLYGWSPECTLYSDQKDIFYEGKKIFSLPDELKGREDHDAENLMAAYLLVKPFNVTPEQFTKAYATFKKPHHRIEFVKEMDGIKFFDDSKGTNIDAVVRAVDKMEGPVLLIAGGVDKGAAYTPWTKSFNGKVKCIFAIGEAASKIAQDLNPSIEVKMMKTLEEATQEGFKRASRGDNVLLSPGCSSFDMFRDYAHRGEVFQQCVHSLAKKI